MALRLDGYLRVSRIGGRSGEAYIAPHVQREAIEAYARDLEGEVAAWHQDEDFSGGNIERPGFQRVLERLRDGDTDGVVVKNVSRFSRSNADGATIIREIVGRGQIFASCDERMDPRTSSGIYMLNAFLSNAELSLI